MKRKFTSVLCTIIAVLMTCTVFFAGCFGNNTPESTTPKEYTIQYSDDSGTHQPTVAAGTPYSLKVIPSKIGYTFMGLYDAEIGGTQYVSSAGASLSTFTDNKNMVLFPQFKVNDYTVILDYQGTPVTGSRQFTVAYGSSLPELPKNLTGDHKEFVGWYTEADCGGTQIADEYGLIPLVSVLNEKNFDLNDAITLYAGFVTEKHTVTFCFESGMDTEEVQVPYNVSISEVVPATRVNGKVVLTWSKTQDGEVWNGKVTNDMVLYAKEYAPVIDFDCNGGNEVAPLVARADSTIALPTPTKDLAKFSHWEDMSGNKFTSTTMPSTSTSLKAVWQAKLVFDENGGSDVDDISVAAGNKITLPTPEKEGYIFVGWYTSDKEQYISTTMPSFGVALKAGWYKEKMGVVRLLSGSQSCDVAQKTLKLRDELTIDLSPLLSENFIGYVNLEFHFQHKYTQGSLSNIATTQLYFYSQPIISENVLLFSRTFQCNSSSNISEVFNQNIALQGNKIYCANVCSTSSGYLDLSDYYINVTYPDTTNLYL